MAAPTRAAEAPVAPPPMMDNMMSSQGWRQRIVISLENETRDDIGMLPAAPGALAREWRSFDHQGSALGALANLGWVALAAGRLAVRIDTYGGRYVEGLDLARSYAVLERRVRRRCAATAASGSCAIWSAAAIWRLRQSLAEAGFTKVKIVASSGFGPEKCHIMAAARAPIDVISTGSTCPGCGRRPMRRPTSSPMTGADGQGRARVSAAPARWQIEGAPPRRRFNSQGMRFFR